MKIWILILKAKHTRNFLDISALLLPNIFVDDISAMVTTHWSLKKIILQATIFNTHNSQKSLEQRNKNLYIVLRNTKNDSN